MDIHPNEMGDIGPALSLLLLAHAGYARRDPEYSRAMRDVAEKALIREINAYLEWRSNKPIEHALRTSALGVSGSPPGPKAPPRSPGDKEVG